MTDAFTLPSPTLSLRLLSEITAAEAPSLIQLMSLEFQAIGDTDNAEDCFAYLMSKPISWLILADNEPAGLIGLSPVIRHANYYQTSTYIFSLYRGTGLNQRVKEAFVQAFLRHPQYHLGAVVRDWNQRSQRALLKTFPTVTPRLEERNEEQRRQDPTWYQWFYDFSTLPIRDVLEEEHALVEPVTVWLQNL